MLGPVGWRSQRLDCLGVEADVEEQIKALSRDDRRVLKVLGIRLGRSAIYMPGLLKPAAITLRAGLWHAWHQPSSPVETPPDGRITVGLNAKQDMGTQRDFLNAIGYTVFPEDGGFIAVRLDMVERIAGKAWSLGRRASFAMDETMMSFAGAGGQRTTAILHGLGFQSREKDGVRLFRPPRPKAAMGKNKPVTPHKKNKRSRPKTPATMRATAPEKDYSDSPFAVLKQLTSGS